MPKAKRRLILSPNSCAKVSSEVVEREACAGDDVQTEKLDNNSKLDFRVTRIWNWLRLFDS